MSHGGRPALQHDWEYGNYIDGGTLEGRVDWDTIDELENHAKGLIEEWDDELRLSLGWSGGIDSLVILHMLYDLGYDHVPCVMTRTVESYPCHPEYATGMADRFGLELDVLVNQQQDLSWVKANKDARLFPDYSVQFESNRQTQREPIAEWSQANDIDMWMNGHRNEHNVTTSYVRQSDSYFEDGTYIGSPIRTWEVPHVVAYLDRYDLPISPVYGSSNPTSGGIPWWRRRGTWESTAESWYRVREIPVEYGYTEKWEEICVEFPNAEDKAGEYAADNRLSLPSIEEGYEMGCDTHPNPYLIGPGVDT